MSDLLFHLSTGRRWDPGRHLRRLVPESRLPRNLSIVSDQNATVCDAGRGSGKSRKMLVDLPKQ
ncbi:unnamed protein product [Mycena citricolor]|uniref:Uncharacterized protein n=1 Tax=Mycena citricolor TaxID=2018698 RepID=A0AAD2GZF6_9AGAR|nr:unnamed protein product [Mycena citricolor]